MPEPIEPAVVRPLAPSGEALPRTERPMTGLIREAFDETRELVQLEIALARAEVTEELARAKAGAAALGVGAGLLISAFTLLMVAVATALATAMFVTLWLSAAILGAILAIVAVVLVSIGRKSIPKKILAETRDRVQSDMKQFKERIA